MSKEFLEEVCKRVKGFGVSEDIPVLYPGVSGSPPSTGMWVELHIFYNDTLDYALGSAAIEQGFLRVFACTRLGSGLLGLVALADKICGLFPKNSMINESIIDTTPSKGGPITHEDRLIIPVTVRYKTIKQRKI